MLLFRNLRCFAPHFGEAVGIASMIMAGGLPEQIICITSSHYCSAERQYRYPWKFATQRTPTSQWTVTAARALASKGRNRSRGGDVLPPARSLDQGIKDATTWERPWAPAAADTIATHFCRNREKNRRITIFNRYG